MDRPVGKIGSVHWTRISHLTPWTESISEIDFFFSFWHIFGFLELLCTLGLKQNFAEENIRLGDLSCGQVWHKTETLLMFGANLFFIPLTELSQTKLIMLV